jgi:hypothetical protein
LYALRLVIFPLPVILNRFDADLFVRIFGIFFLAHVWLWIEHHDHQASVQSRNAFYCPVIDALLCEQVQFLAPKLRVRDFTSLEHAGHFDLVPLFHELLGFLDLKRKIVFSDPRTDLYTLYLGLLALLILPLLALQVFILAIIDDLGNRRIGRRGDENEVEAFVFGNLQRLAALKDA